MRLRLGGMMGAVALVVVPSLGVVPSASGLHGASRAVASFHVQPSVNQVAVTGATPGAVAVLRDAAGREVAEATVDAAGASLFRDVTAGRGYAVTVGNAQSPRVEVTSPTRVPPASFYSSQRLPIGYGYLRTRDGTLLSIDVTLPGPPDRGPYPTVVEYSGYDPSNPNDKQPASTVAQLLGFATVGVNMRGTGCSGGAWDYFEPLQSLDGYDAIETVAAQPWVLDHRVGMVGISYPGITQLFVARTRPPHLAAITPLSVIDDTYATLYPGGILNRGFAVTWATDRQADAKPAGPRWVARRIAAGDKTCRANQALRLQTPNVLAEIRSHRFYDPGRAADLAPAHFVHNIDVPVFLAGSWQDQETGSHFAEMLGDFSPEIPLKATIMNGVHADALGPAVLSQWIEFLDFYVAHRVPQIPSSSRAAFDALLTQLFGRGAVLGPDQFARAPSYAAALSQYESEPRVRVLFDVGAAPTAAPGVPVAAFSTTSPVWPLPHTSASTYYFAAHGGLASQPSSSPHGADRFEYDPAAFPATDAAKGTTRGTRAPAFDWKPVPAGKALAYVSAPLTSNEVMVGTASVDLWLQSNAPDVDLEAVLSEVRPDGRETYVQSGWLRASQRKLDAAASMPLLPVQTHARHDAAPLPAGTPTLVRIPLYPFGHVFRAGSRIRIVIQPPGGNRPAWSFDTIRYRYRVDNLVARDAAHPSKVVLPVVSGIAVPTPLPPCNTLRGQPCRPYVPLTNQPVASGGR